MQRSDPNNTRYVRLRATFGRIFLASTSLFILFLILSFYALTSTGQFGLGPTPTLTPLPSPTPTLPAGAPTPTPTPKPILSESDLDTLTVIGSLVALVASCLTSITTFIGFVTTTVIGLRKEQREAKASELDRKRQEIELEKHRLELERLKKGKRVEEDKDAGA